MCCSRDHRTAGPVCAVVMITEQQDLCAIVMITEQQDLCVM